MKNDALGASRGLCVSEKNDTNFIADLTAVQQFSA